MIRRPPRSTQSRSSAASDVYKRQVPAWSRMIRDADLEPEVSARLSCGEGIELYLAETKEPALAGMLHAMTRTTITPTVVHAGVKTNICLLYTSDAADD